MALTPQATDFPRWYQEIVAGAELAENGPARGTMVIRPYGYAIWERCQHLLDDRIKEAGAENAYFPLFIPMSFFEKEAEHVEGFSPQLAVVTHGGGERLAEPLAVRPTSETVINHLFAKWIQSYRDLPLLINQWCNVVRWELRTRLFLRSSEFLWQEGHTAHATGEEAHRSTLAFLDVYRSFLLEDLAIDAITGEKTSRERFPGADHTYTCEALMRDGKALQSCTSHDLGRNFSQAFDITYQTESGELDHVSTSSWGLSTRVVGGLIMAHGDDAGLRLPPKVAPYEVVVLPLGEGEPLERARSLAKELSSMGRRTKLDERTYLSFGRRSVDWELKGAPVRIEIGPRDVQAGQAVLVRRDTMDKMATPLDGVARQAAEMLAMIQVSLEQDHRSFRESNTFVPKSLDELHALVNNGGFFKVAFCGDEACEDRIAEGTSASIRCLPLDSEPPAPLCLVCGRPARHLALVARAY
jgi:prolyl-tRNA synthetase